MEAPTIDLHLIKHKLEQTQQLLDLKVHDLSMFVELVGHHKVDADLVFLLRTRQAEVKTLRNLRDHWRMLLGELNAEPDVQTVAATGGGDTGEPTEAKPERSWALT